MGSIYLVSRIFIDYELRLDDYSGVVSDFADDEEEDD